MTAILNNSDTAAAKLADLEMAIEGTDRLVHIGPAVLCWDSQCAYSIGEDSVTRGAVIDIMRRLDLNALRASRS